MEAIRPAPARHQTTGELINDGHFAILDHVLAIALVKGVRLQRGVQVPGQLVVLRRVEIIDAEPGLDLGDPLLRRLGRTSFLIDRVVDLLLQPHGQASERLVDLRAVLRGTADDEWRPRLVNEDVIHFVDDREVAIALDTAYKIDAHVVAKEIEAELVVRSVDDVRPIRFGPCTGSEVLHVQRLAHLLLREQIGRVVLQHGDRQAELLQRFAVPLRVSLR